MTVEDSREPALPADLAAAIAVAFATVTPPRTLRERVLAAAVPAQTPPVEVMHVVRAAQGQWHELLPGVAIKFLNVDTRTSTQSSLWRLAPGAIVPGHAHEAEEECIVLDGTIRFGDDDYGRGDFLLARPGLDHEPFSAPDGALLFIRSALAPPLERLARRAGVIV